MGERGGDGRRGEERSGSKDGGEHRSGEKAGTGQGDGEREEKRGSGRTPFEQSNRSPKEERRRRGLSAGGDQQGGFSVLGRALALLIDPPTTPSFLRCLPALPNALCSRSLTHPEWRALDAHETDLGLALSRRLRC